MLFKKKGLSISNHRFFENLDLKEIESMKVTPPWKPEISHDSDTKLIQEFGEAHQFQTISHASQTLFVGF